MTKRERRPIESYNDGQSFADSRWRLRLSRRVAAVQG